LSFENLVVLECNFGEESTKFDRFIVISKRNGKMNQHFLKWSHYM